VSDLETFEETSKAEASSEETECVHCMGLRCERPHDGPCKCPCFRCHKACTCVVCQQEPEFGASAAPLDVARPKPSPKPKVAKASKPPKVSHKAIAERSQFKLEVFKNWKTADLQLDFELTFDSEGDAGVTIHDADNADDVTLATDIPGLDEVIGILVKMRDAAVVETLRRRREKK
jgi:hypothetical protein